VLRAPTSAPLFTYFTGRLPHFSGASDAADPDRVRHLLHEFVSRIGWPCCWIAFSQGTVCQACGRVIKPYQTEYDIDLGTSELRLDADCYNRLTAELRPRETAE
jgi:hypothetical protein